MTSLTWVANNDDVIDEYDVMMGKRKKWPSKGKVKRLLKISASSLRNGE